MGDSTMRYAVNCSSCGNVSLTELQYEWQMERPDRLWQCPKCRGIAEWDDETYEANFTPETDDA